MTQVSYFQRYSQPENHATNNTLLLLRYAYQADPLRLQRALTRLFDDADLTVGLTFQQQTGGAASVPDALIGQSGFRIYVEAKRGGELDAAQIDRHLRTIEAARGEGRPYLLGLTRTSLPEAEQVRFRARAAAAAVPVSFGCTTFGELADIIRSEFEVNETIGDLVDDYQAFLTSCGLIDDRDRWLPIFPCGLSYSENERYALYYDPPARPLKTSRFLGVYARKRVSLVGEVETVAHFQYTPTGAEMLVHELGTAVTEAQRARVQAMMEATTVYDLKRDPLRVYLMGPMAATDLAKSTPGGIMGLRYLDLQALLGVGEDLRALSNAQALADRLRGKTFA